MKNYNNILLTTIIIIFSVFYNVGAGIFIFFDVSPSTINLLVKIIGTLSCGFLFAKAFDFNFLSIPKDSIPLLLFLLVYSLRLLIDVFFLQRISNYPNILIISYFFGGTLMTSLAISIFKKSIDLNFILKYYIIVLFISNFVVFVLMLKNNNFNFLTIFNQRLSFGLSDSDNNDIINSITISLNGALVLFYYFFKSNFNFTVVKVNFIIDSFIIFISLVNLIFSGSRGPLLALFVVGILILIQSKKINFSILSGLAASIFLLLFIVITYFDISFSDIAYFKRIFDDGEFTLFNDENRVELFNSSFKQFLNHPLLGDRYFEENTKSYPHNIFLEVLMSTGLLGGVLFVSNLLVFFYRYIQQFRVVNGNTFLFFLTLFYFLCSLFSSSIWGNIEFFIFSILYFKTYNSSKFKNV